MDIDINKYRRVSDSIEDLNSRYRSVIDEVRKTVHIPDINLSKLYFTLHILKQTDKISYADLSNDAINILIKSQITGGEEIEFMDGLTGDVEKGLANEYMAGGFPTIISKGKMIIQGNLPSIISTCLSLEIIIDYIIETQYWDDRLDETLRSGFNYLRLRDENRDGLLEQDPYEDWIPYLRRDGSPLYANSIYLKFLEDLYYLYIDKDKVFSDEVKEVYLKLYRRIEDLYWINDHYADNISSAFTIYIRNSIDSSLVAYPLIGREGDRVRRHLHTILNNLKYDDIILASEDRVRASPEYRGREYISSPYHTSIYALITLENGLLNLTLEALDKTIPYYKYSYIFIDDGKKKKVKNRDTYHTVILLLGVYKLLSKIIRRGGGHQLV